jgi:hypothetical protein
MNNRSIPSTHAERQTTDFLYNTPLLYIPLLALTDGQNDRQTEKQIHSLRVGWRNFFPVVLLCQFFVLARNRVWFYILTYVTEQIILRTNIFLTVVEVLRFLAVDDWRMSTLLTWPWWSPEDVYTHGRL